MIGNAKARKLAIDFVGSVASPGLIIGTIMYVPLLNRVRNEIVAMGLRARTAVQGGAAVLHPR